MYSRFIANNLWNRALYCFVSIGIVFSSYGTVADEVPRLVVLYAPCTVSAKFLDPYGAAGLTPHIARFAKDAAVFTAHRTEANGSGPAFASIFAGQQADGHGVFSHPSEVAARVQDLSEVLAAAGYEIFYFGSHRMADHDLGYVQASDYATDSLPYPKSPALQDALDRLAANSRAKLAVFAAFSVTHSPYDRAPLELFQLKHPYHPVAEMDRETVDRLYALYYEHVVPLKLRYERTVHELGLSAADQNQLEVLADGLYRSNVDRLDSMFGGLLDEIEQRGLRDESLVLFTADHGESVNEANAPTRWTHAGSLRNEVLTVPFLVAGSGVTPGRHTFVTRSIDVAPTVAGLLNVPPSPQWQGVDLSGVLRGLEKAPRLRAFSRRAGVSRGGNPAENSFPHTWAAVRDGDLVVKYRSTNGELDYRAYNVDEDPDETTNILDLTNPWHVDLIHALKCYRVRLWRSYCAAQAATEVPDDAEDTLRSLGYIE